MRAYDFSAGGIFYNINEDGKSVTVTSGDEGDIKYSGHIVIPSEVSGYSVTSIGAWAFGGCTSLTSVDLPAGLTGIGTWAFSGCTSLASIDLPAGLTSLGTAAFWGCKSLASIVIPTGVTNIDGVFESCTSLTSVALHPGVTSMRAAFANCTSLASIHLPAGLTDIGYGAFMGCESLASVVIPASVTSIGDGAFRFCTSLTSVDLPASVTTIGLVAFEGCTSLTSFICRAIDMPELGRFVFRETPTGMATLYVPASALDDYKVTAPWTYFGRILPLEDYDTGIGTPASAQDGTPAYYTPSGQRAPHPVRGHIYIRRGRKVMF